MLSSVGTPRPRSVRAASMLGARAYPSREPLSKYMASGAVIGIVVR